MLDPTPAEMQKPMQEAGVIISKDFMPLFWWQPPGRTGGSLPDLAELWDALWAYRDQAIGFAHTHPGKGPPWPSRIDLTTFAAVELGLGRKLYWPIATEDCMTVFHWEGPGKIDYEPSDISGPNRVFQAIYKHESNWIDHLRKISYPEVKNERDSSSDVQGSAGATEG